MKSYQSPPKISTRKWHRPAMGGEICQQPLFPPHPLCPGPGRVSAGRPGFTGVEPPQLAEAGESELEQHLLLGAQRMCQDPQGFTLQYCEWAGVCGTLLDYMLPQTSIAQQQLPTDPCPSPLQHLPESLPVPVVPTCLACPYRSSRQPGWQVPGR